MIDFSEWNIILKLIICTFSLHFGGCTIAGISYMDPLNQRELQSGEDPCNPLYWYPRALPEFCYIKSSPNLKVSNFPPIPMPIPIPLPMPVIPPFFPPPMIPSPMMEPPVPLPFGVPLHHPMVPPPLPFPPPPPLPPPMPPPPPPYLFPPPYGNVPFGHGAAGFIPGLPGLVSQDGGINILPFSDVYADVLEKHKQKMIRKHLEKIFSKYRGYRKRRRRYRNWRRNNEE